MDTQEVVVVTINYRLSALGWLVLKEEGVEGNQVWVQRMMMMMITVMMIMMMPGTAGHGGGTALGAGQYRGFWRRS